MTPRAERTALSDRPDGSTPDRDDFAQLVEQRVASRRRIDAVEASGLFDTTAAEPFDALAELAAELLDAPLAFVTVVGEHRSFWKACIGIDIVEDSDREQPVEESFCQYVIGADEALLIPDARLDPRTNQNPLIASQGVVAWAGHPIRNRDGDILGTFCVVDTRPRPWSERDGRILKVFAESVASAIDLRASTSATELLNERGAHLALLARRLTSSVTTDEVAQSIVELGADVVGAASAFVAFLDDEQSTVTISLPSSSDPELTLHFVEVPLDVSMPMTDCMRIGKPVVVVDADERAERYPELSSAMGAHGIVTTISLPLFDIDGIVIGALGVGWATRYERPQDDHRLLDALATMCAQTFERSRLADSRGRVIESLQDYLLPPVGRIEHLDISVRYLPANDRVGLGGDWYQVLELDDSRTVLVIGDIAGHGVEATARMAQVQASLNAMIYLGTPLEALIGLTELGLAHLRDPYIATVDVCVLDTTAHTIDHISAGHPPPVLWTPETGAITLDGGRRRLMGLPGGDAPVETVGFPRGAVMVSFTDGLVERRDEPLEVSIDAVCRYLDDHHDSSAEEIADGLLVARFGVDPSAGIRRDDTALAVIAHR